MNSRNKKGQSLVEFALVMPLLIFLLLAIVEFGMILHAQVTLVHAAREGARYGSITSAVPERNAEAVRIRTADAAAGLGINTTSINVTYPNDDKIEVVVNHELAVLNPIFAALMNVIVNRRTLELNGRAIMALE